MSKITIQFGDSLDLCRDWPSPVVIVSDGPYGVGGYDGDLKDQDGLAEWYGPFIEAWSERATSATTLWFWNTEVGWAEVHPVLKQNGWIYRSCNVWDKGIAHVSGNTNTKTLRRFPVVTEICAHYIRKPTFFLPGGRQDLSAQSWLRSEWARTGLPFSHSNEACGVKNAATRKYLTPDHLWYFPPAEMFQKLVEYANDRGEVSGRPYFSIDGANVMTGPQWEQTRGKFFCPLGITNVWQTPAVRGDERIKVEGSALHPNQKPLSLMRRIVECSSEPGDVIWEPFAGLATASIASNAMGRPSYAAEIDQDVYRHALARVDRETVSGCVEV